MKRNKSSMIISLILINYFNLIKYNRNYFHERVLQIPQSTIILWSIDDLSEQLRRWTRIYGSIYVVSNVDFLNEVFVKEFRSFHIRSVPFLMKEYRKHEIHLFGTDGQIWQRQKQIISQFFSSFYLKLMTKKIANSIEILFNKLNQFEQNQFDIYEHFQIFAMNTICMFIREFDLFNKQKRLFSLFEVIVHLA